MKEGADTKEGTDTEEGVAMDVRLHKHYTIYKNT